MNFCIIEIKGKNPKRLIKEFDRLNIDLYNIKYYRNRLLIKIKYEDYQKIAKIKTSCEIKIVKVYGVRFLKQLFDSYKVFIIFFIFTIVAIILLAKFTFFINIKTEDSKMYNLLKEELNKYGLTIFSLKPNYEKLSAIKDSIKYDCQDKIEWLELKQNGVILEVEFIERKQEEDSENKENMDIVASKNGYIMDMEVTSGEIRKNTGDYVKKGEVIVSSSITRNDKIVAKTSAKANVYAEVWYRVRINSPFEAIINSETGNKKKELVIKIFDKSFTIFSYKSKNSKEKTFFSNAFFTLELKSTPITVETKETYSKEALQKKLEDLALEKIKEQLGTNERILQQKTLKVSQNNATMNIEVFFKVYENIAKAKKSNETIEKEE